MVLLSKPVLIALIKHYRGRQGIIISFFAGGIFRFKNLKISFFAGWFL